MKDLSDVRLFDLYGALLTETQREICALYYLFDLSLTEIGEEKGVTKQAVSDCISKSRAQLWAVEEKLGFSAHLADFSARHPELEGELSEIFASGGKGE